MSPAHLLANMHSLVAVAPLLQGVLGRRHVLHLYVGGGVTASVVSLLWHRLQSGGARGRRSGVRDDDGGAYGGSLGASGAVMALLACNALLFPHQQYQYWGGLTLDATQMLATKVALGASARYRHPAGSLLVAMKGTPLSVSLHQPSLCRR